MYAHHAHRLTALTLGLLVALSIAAPVAATGEHFRGRLVSYHAEDASMTRTVVAGYALESNGQHYRLNFRDTSLAAYVGHNVELTGTRSGRTINVSGYQADTQAVAAAQNQNVAGIMLNFPNDTRQP